MTSPLLATLLAAIAPTVSPGDPVLGGPAWTAESHQAGSRFGGSVAGAGDVDGDGFDDVIVGAPQHEHGQTNEGRAYVYLGSPIGPALAAGWLVEGDRAFASLGSSVAGAGDVNGDGFDDVIVGADGYTNGQTGEGRALVYHGSASGLSTIASWSVEGDQIEAFLGRCVASAGDVNGDGYDDVLVGAPDRTNGQHDEGMALLYLGSAAGLSTTPAWTAEGDVFLADLGSSVAGAGDVDGDGYDDVIVGDSELGRALLFTGSSAGLSASAVWTFTAGQFTGFGASVAGAGDVNGDGFHDLVIGAPIQDGGEAAEGFAYLFLGSAVGPMASPDWTVEGEQAFALLGQSVAGAGDVDGDGYDDVLVGSRLHDGSESDEGRIALYLGSANGLASTPAWTAEGGRAGAELHVLAGAGDVNGDGFPDVIAGAERFDAGQPDAGRAFVHLGHDGEVGSAYCTATSSSMGAPAELSAAGSASAGAANLLLSTHPVPNDAGVFFHGASQAQIAFGCGHLCAVGDLRRGSVVLAAGNVARYLYDRSTDRHDVAAFVGATRNFQYWFRDLAGAPACSGWTFNTSNALSILIRP